MDKLEQIFKMQEELNEFTLVSNGQTPFSAIKYDRILQNQWLKNYTIAMMKELSELLDSTNWKWWRTKVDLFDEQNAKVELVDILHFWVSACQVLGLSAEDIFRMYTQKNKINTKRQERGYLTKEDDNKSIG